MGQGMLVFGAQHALSRLQVGARSPTSLVLILLVGDLRETDTLGFSIVSPVVPISMPHTHLSLTPAFSLTASLSQVLLRPPES